MSDWREELVGVARARMRDSAGNERGPLAKRRELERLLRDVEEGRALPALSHADWDAGINILRRVREDVLRQGLRDEVIARTFYGDDEPVPPSIAKRDLKRLLTKVKDRRGNFSDLSPEERAFAAQYIQQEVARIPEGKNGHPTDNPAAMGFKLVEDFALREVLPRYPNLDQKRDTHGRGNVGLPGFLEKFARMVRDAPPKPGTHPDIVAESRKLFGSDEDLADYARSWRRSDRRRRSKPKR